MFAKGRKYRSCGVHAYSDNPIVCDSDEDCVILLEQIERKIMLYPLDHEELGRYAIIDHQRTTVPLSPNDVPVPQYPECGDIVSVNGQNGKTWIAKIHSVQISQKTCQVYFYVQGRDIANLCTTCWSICTGIPSWLYRQTCSGITMTPFC